MAATTTITRATILLEKRTTTRTNLGGTTKAEDAEEKKRMEQEEFFNTPVLNKLFTQWSQRCSNCGSLHTKAAKHKINNCGVIRHHYSPIWFTDPTSGSKICFTCYAKTGKYKDHIKQRKARKEELINKALDLLDQKEREEEQQQQQQNREEVKEGG